MKLLLDFLPVLLFFAVYQISRSTGGDARDAFLVATPVLIVASMAQLAWTWHKSRKIEKMPLITVILLLVFGGITLVLQDEIYLKWKPTVVNWLFAAAFVGSQFIGAKTIIERMMGGAMDLPGSIWTRLNLAWAIFFVAMGAVNLYVAFNYDTDTWVNFKLFGMLGLTLVFVIAQAVYLARYLPAEKEQTEE